MNFYNPTSLNISSNRAPSILAVFMLAALFFCATSNAAPVGAKVATDRAALAALYNATGGANWEVNTNWLSGRPLGEWYGVTANSSGSVTRINLEYNELTGAIPAELSNLSNLREVIFTGNQLSGSIPPELGDLSSLGWLQLDGNQLSGAIPSELGGLSNLRGLDISDNRLSGSIPRELGNLSNLRILYLYVNELSGVIPSELGNLSNLERLGLRGNLLNGCIPVGLRDVSESDSERLGLPFCDASDRAVLVAFYNATDGPDWTNNTNWIIDAPIGQWHGVTTNVSGRVTRLDLDDNRLTGEIPAALDSLSALESLHLSSNELTGCVPEGLWYVPDNDFDQLGLPFCTVDKSALVALYNATDGPDWTNNTNWLTDAPMGQWHGVATDVSGRVTHLDLDNNGLMGQIPHELDNLDKLDMLFLSGNRLTGCVPVRLQDVSENDFGRLGLPFCSVDRAALIALYNATDGPNWETNTNWLSDRPIGEWSGVGVGYMGGRVQRVDLRGRVKELNFYDNRMTGSIPPEIGSLANLEWLNIPSNRLSGPIPQEIGSLERLWWLNLGNNELSGEIPPELGKLFNLQAMYLGSNQLSGPIPSELGRLGNLKHLVLSGNQLTGEIPSELGGLSSLMQLRLAENQLTGPIPSELGSLSNLRRWRLGDNRLTGCVPQGLATVKNNGISQLGLTVCGDGQATPTPTPAPRYPVVTRSEEYGYTIDILDGWVEEDGYVRSIPGGKMFVRELDLAVGTTLDRFAESVRDNLRQEWWSSASLFQITSFGKRRLGDQDFYWMEYRVQESPKYCLLDVVELIALGTSLPGAPKGFRAIHRSCNWELPGGLDSTRRETLESFRVVTTPATYYTQFVYVPGATIKAAGTVDHFAMQEAAKVAAVMLGGRRDVVDCLERRGASLAIVPDGDPVTSLPEFASLKGGKDHWGQSHDSTYTPGLGGVPVASTSEQRLLGAAGYPPNRDTHEPAHLWMLTCFTADDHKKWTAIHGRAVDKVLSEFGFDTQPFHYGLMINPDEFFAGLSVRYFFGHRMPRRYVEQYFPEAFAFLKEFYGILTPMDSDRPGWTQYVNPLGVPLPWLVPSGGRYKHGTLGYSIDIPTQTELVAEEDYSTRWEGHGLFIEVRYIDLSGYRFVGDELRQFAEQRRVEVERRATVTSLEPETIDGQDSYWLSYVTQGGWDVIERMLVASFGGREYVVLMKAYIHENEAQIPPQDRENVLRSFKLAGMDAPASK